MGDEKMSYICLCGRFYNNAQDAALCGDGPFIKAMDTSKIDEGISSFLTPAIDALKETCDEMNLKVKND